ncbi:MAG: hypothetical protein V8R14_04860 [Clostridia bacterium]
MYTDLSIMTANEDIGRDGTAFFRNMLTGNLDGQYKELLVAPAGIKPALMEMIDGEISKGGDGYICMKINSVTDRDIIDKLAEASRAGVDIQLIVRGICCIRAGIAGETENVTVTSIVGRYLEHARIYCFGRGGSAGLYISSADLMTRNLSRRVEIAGPVHDEDIKRQLIRILEVQLSDKAKASLMQPDGSYIRKCEGRSSGAGQPAGIHGRNAPTMCKMRRFRRKHTTDFSAGSRRFSENHKKCRQIVAVFRKKACIISVYVYNILKWYRFKIGTET